MSKVYSLSIEGIQNAQTALERAARNIATGRGSVSPSDSGDKVDISSAGMLAAYPTADATVDYAAELLAVKQAEVALKANFKVFASQQKLEQETLDLFA